MLTTDGHDGVVFLLDVDNTLIGNESFRADLDARLLREIGEQASRRYWQGYEDERERLGYADYLGALEPLRDGHEADPGLLGMSDFVLDYPFDERLYPEALATVAHLGTLGLAAVLSDGDVVLQPRKIRRSGVWDAVQGRVMICLHKQSMLDAMRRHFPARHHVMVDDKIELLAAMKRSMGKDLTTVYVRQGHYPVEAAGQTHLPPPDIVIERIAELSAFDLPRLLASASGAMDADATLRAAGTESPSTLQESP